MNVKKNYRNICNYFLFAYCIYPLLSMTSICSSRICVTFGRVSSAFSTGNVFDKKSNVRFRINSLEITSTKQKFPFNYHFDSENIYRLQKYFHHFDCFCTLTMGMVRPIHFVPLDCVVFDPYSSHHKYCAPIQRRSYWGCLCIRDEHACMGVDERSVVWLRLIQQMHNIFKVKAKIGQHILFKLLHVEFALLQLN